MARSSSSLRLSLLVSCLLLGCAYQASASGRELLKAVTSCAGAISAKTCEDPTKAGVRVCSVGGAPYTSKTG